MEKYRIVKWNREIAIQRERNKEIPESALLNRYDVDGTWQPIKTNNVPILKIIFSVSLALVLVGFIFFESGLMFTNGVINKVDSHLQNQAQTAQLKIKQEKTALDVELERLKLERERVELQEAEVNLKRKQIEEKNKLAYIKEQDDQRLKESKWKAFYKKPDNCSPPPTHQIRVECGNFYMREKARFDDLYSKGKI